MQHARFISVVILNYIRIEKKLIVLWFFDFSLFYQYRATEIEKIKKQFQYILIRITLYSSFLCIILWIAKYFVFTSFPQVSHNRLYCSSWIYEWIFNCLEFRNTLSHFLQFQNLEEISTGFVFNFSFIIRPQFFNLDCFLNTILLYCSNMLRNRCPLSTMFEKSELDSSKICFLYFSSLHM
jgi:hypothetical protein